MASRGRSRPRKKHKHKHKRNASSFAQRKKKKKLNRRSRSEGVHDHYNYKHFQNNPRKIERKLGPLDMGRIKYKGTKYKESDYDFLAEKVHKHARSSSFTLRKKANPVEKRPTLSDIGTPNSWRKPLYYDSENEKMQRGGLDFLEDTKPMHVRDKSLDNLGPINKGTFSGQEMRPFAWKPIDYEVKQDKSHFLTEKFWFEASKLNVEDGFSQLLQTLPPEKLLLIQDLPPPTGYESKMNYLNKLKKIVFAQDRLLRTDSSLLSVPLSTLNESSGDESDISQLSDFVDSIENEFDQQYTDALDEILRSQSNSPSDLNVDIDSIQNDNHREDEKDDATKLRQLETTISAEELDKQMTAALDEILRQKSCPPLQDDEDEEKKDDMDLDQRMEDALIEILGPSPSPPQSIMLEDEHNVNDAIPTMSNKRSRSRKELLEKVQMNLDDIQSKTVQNEKSKKKDEPIQAPSPSDTKKDNKKDKSHHNIPANFICPISKKIINDAVMASDGRIYDRVHIEKWLKSHDTSPISGQKLRHKNLMAFSELSDKINHWKLKNTVKKRRKKKRKSGSGQKTKSSSSETSDSNATESEDNLSNDGVHLLSSHSSLSVLSETSQKEKQDEKVEIGIDSSDTS